MDIKDNKIECREDLALVLVWNSVLTLPRVEVLNAVGISMLAALTPRLNGRAFHSAVGAIDTAIALLRSDKCFALHTLIKKSAGIFRHGLLFGKATFGTGNGGF